MRYLPLSEFVSLSRRFHIFDKGPGYDNTLLTEGLFPPLPVCGNDLVWGFTILSAAESAGLNELPVVDIPRQGSLLRALKLENRTGKYTWAEQLAIAALCEELGENEDHDAVSRAVSGNSGFFSRIDRYRKLPGYLANRVNAKRIDLGIAEKITALPEAACDLVFSACGLSFSQIRGFLVNLAEVSRRDTLSTDEVISRTTDALASTDPAAALDRVRNPGLSDLVARFDRITERYTKGTGVRIEPPQFFEGDGYSISFSFSTGGELERKRKVVEKIEGICDELEDLL